MEVTRENFKLVYPTIDNEIKECEYLSIDCEFTGIESCTGYANYFDTAEERYEKRMKHEMKYDIVQFGLSIFKRDANDEELKCTTYNFYIFKYHVENSILPDHKMMISSSAFEFLALNEFDFNKLFRHGITYCNVDEELRLKASLKRKDHEFLLNEKVDFKKQKIVHESLLEFNEFLSNAEQQQIELGPYEKCKLELVKETIQSAERNRRNSANTNLGLITVGLGLEFQVFREKNTNYWRLRVSKTKEDDQTDSSRTFKFNNEEIAEQSIGFSKIVQAIIQYRKPIVGHNVLIDVMHIIHQFVAPLPSNYEDFKFIAREIFPFIFDTKHMSVFLKQLNHQRGELVFLCLITF